MKRIIAAAIGIVIMLIMCSCQAEIKNNESQSISSKQESTDISTGTDSSNGVIDGGFTQEYEYNSDNQITKVSIYSKQTNELRAVSENTYNDNGTLKSIVLKDSKGNVMVTNKYKYKKDPSGEPYVSEETYYDSSDKVALTTKYEYSKENNCPVVSGYYNGNEDEITQNQANEIIIELNRFMN
ncbi:MAG: hypothetical protein K6F76_05385 [Clostridiales bacterium]|nr:hypothetical protein [Clostridiales bacterium]